MLVGCCFCYKKIESTDYDPCNLLVVTNYGKEEDKQKSQVFYCHVACFQEKLDPTILPELGYLLGHTKD
jgi:hypothetical protein